MSRLTGKQRAFIDHWFANNFNGTKAARLAGYSGDDRALSAIASQNLGKPRIRAEIERRWAAHGGITPQEIITRLSDTARSSVDDLLDGDGKLDLQKVKAKGHLVKKLYRNKYGPVVELHDAQRAQELIGKHFGLFVDRIEHSGKDGGKIQIESTYTEGEGIRALSALFDAAAAIHGGGLSGGDAGQEDAVDAAEQATVGSGTDDSR